MTSATTTARIALTTTAGPEDARRIARTLVEEHLVACATLLPAAESIYRWQGQIETASETLLLLKTDQSRIEALQARLLALHPYDTPEFVVLPIETGTESYLAWIRSGLGLE